MTLDVALLVGVVGLALLVSGLLSTTRTLQRRVDDLQSALDRTRALQRRAPDAAGAAAAAPSPAAVPSPAVVPSPAAVPSPAVVPSPAAAPLPAAGPLPDDAQDDLLPPLAGTSSDGAPVSVPLVADGPALVAFLSTTCTICVGVWRRLAEGELEGVRPGVRAVVVTKDPGTEDLAAVRALAGGSGATVVMSSEAWDDYEVPGSPYFLVVDGDPADVVTEGSAQGWPDVVAMVRRGVTV